MFSNTLVRLFKIVVRVCLSYFLTSGFFFDKLLKEWFIDNELKNCSYANFYKLFGEML